MCTTVARRQLLNAYFGATTLVGIVRHLLFTLSLMGSAPIICLVSFRAFDLQDHSDQDLMYHSNAMACSILTHTQACWPNYCTGSSICTGSPTGASSPLATLHPHTARKEHISHNSLTFRGCFADVLRVSHYMFRMFCGRFADVLRTFCGRFAHFTQHNSHISRTFRGRFADASRISHYTYRMFRGRFAHFRDCESVSHPGCG